MKIRVGGEHRLTKSRWISHDINIICTFDASRLSGPTGKVIEINVMPDKVNRLVIVIYKRG